MIRVANMNESDRRVMFLNTAEKKNIHPAIVEKDFWVCYLPDHLFHRNEYQQSFVFKGGTSLSMAYHLIERFSEDIDLILDLADNKIRNGRCMAGKKPEQAKSI